MGKTNTELLNKIDTGGLAAGGLLLPEQAKQFFKMTFEATPFSKLHRKEQRRVKTGEIDKIGVGRRLLRKKSEGIDDNYRAGVDHGKVEYATVAQRLPWEITEETFLENIEGEGYEDLVMGLMTTQMGIDCEDLHFNGDTASADPFLNINDGWLKIINNGVGAHVVDCVADQKYNKGIMFRILNTLPSKYADPSKVKWIMSPRRHNLYKEYLSNRATPGGDNILAGGNDLAIRPLGFDVVVVPSVPDNIILFGDPKNFVAVWTYSIRIRKTTEGREAVMEDKRFYVIHFDDDPIIQELDAVVLAKNITETIGD